MLRTSHEPSAADDDGVPGLPPLDGETDEDVEHAADDLGSDDIGAWDDERVMDGLEVGLDDLGDVLLPHAFDEETQINASDAESSAELMFEVLEGAEQDERANWSAEDVRPLDLVGDSLVIDLPPLALDDQNGLEQDLAEEAGLSPLPPLQEEKSDDTLEDDSWLIDYALPQLPAMADTRSSASITIAPGVRWPALAGVTLQELAFPGEPSTLAACASTAAGMLVYAGGLFRLQAGVLTRFGGIGLEGEPRDLLTSRGDGQRVWALAAGHAQFSDDGGLTFGPPMVIESGAPLRGAMTADGAAWIVCHGELYLCRPGELYSSKVPCGLIATDIVSDGVRNLWLLTEDGQLHLSQDAAKSFEYVASWKQGCQALLACGDTLVVVTPDGPLVLDDEGWREVFGASSHALSLWLDADGASLYACVHLGEHWTLVRVPLGGMGRRAAVLSSLPAHLSAPRLMCVAAEGDKTQILVGLEHGFACVQVPSDQE